MAKRAVAGRLVSIPEGLTVNPLCGVVVVEHDVVAIPLLAANSVDGNLWAVASRDWATRLHFVEDTDRALPQEWDWDRIRAHAEGISLGTASPCITIYAPRR